MGGQAMPLNWEVRRFLFSSLERKYLSAIVFLVGRAWNLSGE